jgi:hypothetical protein
MTELILNYGLFWRRDRVDWKSRKGPLLGLGKSAKLQGEVDFTLQRGIYALYDDNFRLVYVGQAGRGKTRGLFRRLRSHTVNDMSERWSRFSWFGVLSVAETALPGTRRGVLTEVLEEQSTNVRSILDHVEAVLIMAGEPVLNKRGGTFGENVRHYRQVANRDPTQPETLTPDDDEE